MSSKKISTSLLDIFQKKRDKTKLFLNKFKRQRNLSTSTPTLQHTITSKKILPKKGESDKNSKQNTTLFDKCPHFYGNYMPKFACCNKFYGCYLCHNENEEHIYQFSNKVACLFCKTVYAGKTCPKCKANQLFQRKSIL